MTLTTDEESLRPIKIATRTYPPAKVRGISSSFVNTLVSGELADGLAGIIGAKDEEIPRTLAGG